MRKTKIQRVTAFVLAFVFLLVGTVGASAAQAAGESTTTESLSNIKELLNAIPYNVYLEENAGVARAQSPIVIDAAESFTFTMADGTVYNQNNAPVDNDNVAHRAEYDGVAGLYLPGNGTVSWTTDEVKTAAKYSISIEYYPVVKKSTSIERVFMINGAVPFAEARFLTISKIWSNVYSDGAFLVPEGESADSYLSKAKEMGIDARSEQRSDGTYIVYKMPAYWTKDISSLVDEQTVRFFTIDIDKNELRASLAQTPEWTTYEFRDANGFYEESFEFVVAPDENGLVTLSLEAVNEPIAIKSITLKPHESAMSYDDYIKQYENAPAGGDKIKIEAEYFSNASTQTIYPIEDKSSAINSPSAADRAVLNTVGGEKWQGAGQWLSYKFTVGSSGLYEIATRFRQNVLDGMYVSRSLSIYSDSTVSEGEEGYYNGIPFAEAANLQFGFSDDWQSNCLNDGTRDSFKFYFKEGVVYTLKFEVTLGNMGDIVNTVQASLDAINEDYLNIIKLTGSSPDDNRDYGFNRVLPDTMIDLIVQSRTLTAVAEKLAGVAGNKSSMTATLEKIARLLHTMGTDEEQVAKNLDQLKTNIGSLGTWLGDAKTQPLMLDYIVVQPESEELPEAKAGFWKGIGFELKKFWKSFFRNYDRMGSLEEVEEGAATEVWLATGRDQSQVLRSLINNDFTPNTGIAVDLKLVAAGTLLPSILSRRGPDVYIGLDQGTIINYAIRGALLPVDDQEDFGEAIKEFNDPAMIVLGIENSDGEFHYYGLPETQVFNMMFIRKDVLANLEIEVPRTWDDVLEAIPVLQANNMMIGMHTDYKIFLYQMGGELYADDGMRINLDSNVGLEAFDTMCNMFTMYSFPYQYDFANRFRTGEMPIGFAAYTTTYNQLKVFATEIEGLWGFYPMPGYADEEGNINNVSVSTVTAISMITGCEDKKAGWEFMKWHSGAECQVDYSNEMVAIMGPSAKHSTANLNALESMPWTSEEYKQLSLQFNKLASIPNYPGSYIIDRYTNFAFLAAFNENADPVTELQSYITTINKEITRKRQEFELETLDYIGQTLAEKRMLEAIAVLDEIKASNSYSDSYEAAYTRAINAMENGNTEDFGALRAAADELEATNATLFAKAVEYMRSASNSLETYEAYK